MQVTSLGVLQIPDIDAIIHTSDFSCIKATSVGQQPAGPPIFGYNSDPAHEDVPFPDYSYWGHEYTRLRGAPSQGCIAACQLRHCMFQKLEAQLQLSNPYIHSVLVLPLQSSIFCILLTCHNCTQMIKSLSALQMTTSTTGMAGTCSTSGSDSFMQTPVW